MLVKTMQHWAWVHKWTSLICTVFLLILCVTGLPLIFRDEIDELLHEEVPPAQVPVGAPLASLDAIVSSARDRYPGEFIQLVIWPRDEPNVVFLSIAKTPDADPSKNKGARFDIHTGQFLDQPDLRSRLTYFLLQIHTNLFSGLPGKLFLGSMGLLFIASIVSGVVLYAPWTRKLEFGTVRWGKSRLRWLDLHNLLGAITILWALTVGFTGVLNTWADLILKIWQFEQLAEMTSTYKETAPPIKLASIEIAVRTAVEINPEMTPSFVAFPGSPFSSKSHYAVFMRGKAPLTSRMLKPALIDAANGQLTDSRELSWYVKSLLLSQPLHFGDYGGMPLKIIWAILDTITIIILGTGLYLWYMRWQGKSTFARRPATTVGALPVADIVKQVPSSGRARRLQTVFAWPLILGAITTAGLACALAGDGAWDMVSWVLLITPMAVTLWCGWRNRRARTAAARRRGRPSSEPTSQARL